jgi:hypothetical protein
MKRPIFILIACAFVAAPAMADPYGTADVKFGGLNKVVVVKISDASLNVAENVYAGLYNLVIDNALKPDGVTPLTFGTIGVLDDTTGFCIDIFDNSDSHLNPYDVVPLAESPDWGWMGAVKAQEVGNMLDVFWTTNISRKDAAALQVALWEIVNEPGSAYDVASGDFQLKGVADSEYSFSDIRDRANQMLSGGADRGGEYVALSNPQLSDPDKLYHYQDYVVRVPVPAAALLGLLGLGAAGIRLRRFA